MKSTNVNSLPLLNKVIDHLYETIGRIPQWNDYILLRQSSFKNDNMSDILFIPDLKRNEQDTYYFQAPCNSTRTTKQSLIAGAYSYRLGKKYGAVYGQQMGMVFVQDQIENITNSDFKTQKLLGVNILFNPIHRILKPTTPISNVSPGSIVVSKEYYKLIEDYWDMENTSFELFVVNLSSFL
jgi:hypothetical protein